MSDELDEIGPVLSRARGAEVRTHMTDPLEIRRLGDRRRRVARLKVVGGVAFVAAGAVGLASLVGPGLSVIPGVAQDPSTAVITYKQTEPEGMAGLATDAVLERHDGCLFVGGRATVWPVGTGWDDASGTVLFDPEGQGLSITVGETFPTGMGATVKPTWQLEDSLSEQARSDLDVCLGSDSASQTDVLVITYPRT